MSTKRAPGAGRPSKGDRHLLATRPPRLVADLIIERANQAGASYSEYIAAVLADHVGHPELAQITLKDEELPMAG